MATRAASISGDEPTHSFEEEWPELARRLERFLAAKGVDRWLRADVIQETATRLYPRWETLDHSLPLWNLVATIAVRVIHNHRRKESRIELVADSVSVHKDDVHLRGLQRAQLDKTRSALQQLNTDQRRVLLAEVGEALVPAGTRNRINVLRLRARANLREALGPWAPTGVALRIRSLRTAIERRLAELSQDAHGAMTSIAGVITATTIVLAGTAIDGARAGPPQDPGVLALVGDRDADFYSAVSNIQRPEAANLSRATDQAKKKVPREVVRLCAVVCTRPKGPVEDTAVGAQRQAGDAYKEAEEDFREGERQFKKKWREIEDTLP